MIYFDRIEVVNMLVPLAGKSFILGLDIFFDQKSFRAFNAPHFFLFSD